MRGTRDTKGSPPLGWLRDGLGPGGEVASLSRGAEATPSRPGLFKILMRGTRDCELLVVYRLIAISISARSPAAGALGTLVYVGADGEPGIRLEGNGGLER
jgi:hypothetical protein